MATHDGASDAVDPAVWLTADDIAALSNGLVKANTVRSWWRAGALEFTTFPQLGTKSNKRSSRQDVERFLRLKLGAHLDEAPAAPPSHPPFTGADLGQPPPRLEDLLDTLSSVKAAADAVMQALITEAEHAAAMTAAHAAISRAQAEADTLRAEADVKRVDTLRHLQTMLRGYDLALATHLQPSTPAAALPHD